MHLLSGSDHAILGAPDRGRGRRRANARDGIPRGSSTTGVKQAVCRACHAGGVRFLRDPIGPVSATLAHSTLEHSVRARTPGTTDPGARSPTPTSSPGAVTRRFLRHWPDRRPTGQAAPGGGNRAGDVAADPQCLGQGDGVLVGITIADEPRHHPAPGVADGSRCRRRAVDDEPGRDRAYAPRAKEGKSPGPAGRWLVSRALWLLAGSAAWALHDELPTGRRTAGPSSSRAVPGRRRRPPPPPAISLARPSMSQNGGAVSSQIVEDRLRKQEGDGQCGCSWQAGVESWGGGWCRSSWLEVTG